MGRAVLQYSHCTSDTARGRGSRKGRAARALCPRPGRAAGQQAVHSVHSAYFLPGLTQYHS